MAGMASAMSIRESTLKDMREAWEAFNALSPWSIGVKANAIMHTEYYKAREETWQEYCRHRDHYMYQKGAITLTELNFKWYRHKLREDGYRLKRMMDT